MKLRRVGWSALAIACILAIGWIAQYQVRLKRLVGHDVAVEFTKGTWVSCLPQPESQAIVRAVTARGIIIEERSANIGLVASKQGAVEPCGMYPVPGSPGHYFVPFRQVVWLKQGQAVVWRNWLVW